MLLDLITSEVKILRSLISSSDLPLTFQNDLRSLFSGTITPGGKRHKPSLSFLRFVPSRKQISLYKECLEENPGTVGGASTAVWPPFFPVPFPGCFRLLSPLLPPFLSFYILIVAV